MHASPWPTFFRYFSYRLDVIEVALRKIKEVSEWYKTRNSKIKLYSSSILIIWDARSKSTLPEVRVKIIDMAHVHEMGNNCYTQEGRLDDQSEKDVNVIGGMERLVAVFETLTINTSK